MSKHLINKKEDWAKECIEGYLYSNNENLIALEEYPNVIIHKDFLTLNESNKQVALISGGGSGHEPAHLGFIGHGMLTGVVCGNLFASPSTSAILAAIRLLGSSNKSTGVLLIVKNYTGDRLNFGLAAKRAQLEGINVDWILVDDDIALVNSSNQRDESVGRRGLCGTILIHKIAGALAEQKKSLKEIKEILESILNNNNLKTIGVSLSGRVNLPGEKKEDLNQLGNQIEIGLGIHGEAGRYKTEMSSSKELIKTIMNEYLFLNINDSSSIDICLMINNLGGLSNLEMGVLIKDCVEYLINFKQNIQIKRVYQGHFMTSLNMNGFSITVLNLNDETNKNCNILNLLDSNTTAPSWPRVYGVNLNKKKFEYLKISNFSSNKKSINLINSNDYLSLSKYKDNNYSKLFDLILRNISVDLIECKDYLNELDSICGDADCGSSLANICQQIQNDLNLNMFLFNQPHQICLHLSDIFENGGGSLCILLSLFMSSAVKSFQLNSINFENENNNLYWLKIWHNFLQYGIKSVQEYGRAKPNQRSIIDPLTAINSCLNELIKMNTKLEIKDVLKNLSDEASKSAESTAFMKPRIGRASYVDSSLIKTPDAGAYAVSRVVTSIYKSYLSFISTI